MMITEKVERALKRLTKEDERSPTWAGNFSVEQIAVKCILMSGERPAYPGTVRDDVRLVTNALLKLKDQGVVERGMNGLWRLV